MSPGSRTAIRVIIAIVASIALLLPLVGGVLGFTNRVSTVQATETAPLPADTDSLAVTAARAQVEIRTTRNSTGTITMDYAGTRGKHPSLAVDTVDGRTAVSLNGERNSGFGIGVSQKDELRLIIEVPEEQARAVAVQSEADFAVTSVRGEFQTVSLRTSAGFIDVDTVAESLDITTQTGAISVTGSVRTAKLQTTMGAVSAEGLSVSEKLTATATTGALDLRLGTDALPMGGIDIDVSSGAIDLRVPRITDVEDTPAVGYRVDGRTDSGAFDISIDEVDADTEDPFVPISVRADSSAVDIRYR